MNRILLVTQYFYPENFKSNDVAFDLARRGYQVTVLTGLPNYPEGKIYDGYGLFNKRREVLNGVTVYRTFVIPRGKGGGLRLALNYFSWAVIASFWAFFMSMFRRYDAVIVHETSPVTQGFPALVFKWLSGSPVYFWVLDLWPESLQAAGGVNNRYVLDFFTWITCLMYRNSEKILVSSRGFIRSIIDKGPFEEKLVYFPNWAEDVFSCSPMEDVPVLPDGFKVLFAGNIGEAQDMDSVMNATALLKGKGVYFIIVGDGRKKKWVEEYVEVNGLGDVVFLAGRHPLESMPSFFAQADVLFLSLKDDYIFSLTAPAKLQAYMASAKPVVAMIDGEAREIIREAGCGLSCASGDYVGFAECILRLKASSKDQLYAYGSRGRKYYEDNFRKEICIDNLCRIISEHD